jgi:hypothetical protein
VNTLLKQLTTWPPYPVTVIGLAILAGVGAFELAGGTGNLAVSIPAAFGALGTLKVILPQQSGATIDEVEGLATKVLAAEALPVPLPVATQPQPAAPLSVVKPVIAAIALLALGPVLGACQDQEAPATTAAAAGAASGTAAATTPAPAGIAGALAKVQAWTVTDLNAALADATAHGDQVAMTCYPALITLVQNATTTGALPSATPKGAFSTFQAGRDLANAATGLPGTLKGLNVPCGPMALDAEQTIAQLALQIGGPAAVAVIAPKFPIPLPAIP